MADNNISPASILPTPACFGGSQSDCAEELVSQALFDNGNYDSFHNHHAKPACHRRRFHHPEFLNPFFQIFKLLMEIMKKLIGSCRGVFGNQGSGCRNPFLFSGMK